MAKQNRYREMEKLMTTALIADAVIFVLYLIFAGVGIAWLKIVLAILEILLALGSLSLLYLSRELLKPRSLWLTTGFFSLFLCTLVSLILAFP